VFSEVNKLFRVIEYQIELNEMIKQQLNLSKSSAKDIIEQISK